MKVTKYFVAAMCLLLPLTSMAQTKKSFTLDDLMWGGSNYWNLQPKSIYTAWWGDCLLETDVEEVKTYYNAKGKAEKKVKVLFPF